MISAVFNRILKMHSDISIYHFSVDKLWVMAIRFPSCHFHLQRKCYPLQSVIWLEVKNYAGTNQNVLKWSMNNSWLYVDPLVMNGMYWSVFSCGLLDDDLVKTEHADIKSIFIIIKKHIYPIYISQFVVDGKMWCNFLLHI